GGAECDLRPGGPERDHQVRGLGGDVEAGRETGALERALLGEPGADLSQHRHGSLGPLGAAPTLIRQDNVLDVVCGHRGLYAHGVPQRAADSRSFTRSVRSQVKKSTFWDLPSS